MEEVEEEEEDAEREKGKEERGRAMVGRLGLCVPVPRPASMLGSRRVVDAASSTAFGSFAPFRGKEEEEEEEGGREEKEEEDDDKEAGSSVGSFLFLGRGGLRGALSLTAATAAIIAAAAFCPAWRGSTGLLGGTAGTSSDFIFFFLDFTSAAFDGGCNDGDGGTARGREVVVAALPVVVDEVCKSSMSSSLSSEPSSLARITLFFFFL